MALFLLTKKPLPIANPVNLLLLLRSSSSSSSSSSSVQPTPMAEYLVNTCGFSPDAASRASKHITYLTSSPKPDSVVHFLKQHSFTDPEIRTLVANYPYILATDVESSLRPNLLSLSRMGFSEPYLRRLISLNPQSLQLSSAVSRLEYWRSFLDGDMKKLSLAFTRNRGLINLDIDKGVAPKIALLEAHGLSRTGIATLVVRGHGFFRKSLASMEDLLNRVEQLGFARGSPGFLLGVSSFSSIGLDTLRTKLDIYKSFGWSEEELSSALRKFPFIIRLSEDNIRAKMAFLVERAGCSQGYIALHPQILGYSLHKRMIPRHYVMKIRNALSGREWELYSVMSLSEEKFLDRIILPLKDELPMLLDTYTDACAGKITV